MTAINTIFKVKSPIIGMIHLNALPGTPKNKLNSEEIISNAVKEAKQYFNAGVDAILIENMHDVPYINKEVGHEISTIMAIVGYEIKKTTKLPVGIQILAGANNQALAVAKSASLDFIRAEGFVFGHIADEGYFDSCAAELLRYRKLIDAEDIYIFTDIKKKHSSHSITNDTDILETAKAASFFCSDGIIVTGTSTGENANIEELKLLKNNINAPIIIGSGINYQNIEEYFHLADAFIVGSSFKVDGYWENPIDEAAVTQFMAKIKELR